ncbi:MAG: hypothetical protein ACFB2W_23870 [Leptolyngbyaceae cyanobacterium]
MSERPFHASEQALLDSLTSEQLQLVADWLDMEKLIRIEEGYSHSDLTWSLTWMTHKLRTLAQTEPSAEPSH